MYMMTSHIFKFADSLKTQKPKYLENETFFHQKKKKMNTLRSKT